MTSRIVFGALALAVATAAQAGVPSRQTDWRELGNVYLGMPAAAVQYEYGPYNARRGYSVRGGALVLGFRSKRVFVIGTNSPLFKTPDGYGVGTRIGRTRCVRTSSSRCVRKWGVFTYRPSVLNGSWYARLTYRSQKVGVLLLARNRRITWVFVETCLRSGHVRISKPRPLKLRCGLPI